MGEDDLSEMTLVGGQRFDMFLTANDLADLTGYVVSAYQCRWLDRHGYPFETAATGRPKVLRAYVEKRLGMSVSSVMSEMEPDFSRWQKG